MNGGTCRPTDTGASCTCQPGNKLVIVLLSLSFILYHIYIYYYWYCCYNYYYFNYLNLLLKSAEPQTKLNEIQVYGNIPVLTSFIPVIIFTGYDGNNCENDINECASVTCPGGGTCFDDINKYYCRCPLKKTGTSCSRSKRFVYTSFLLRLHIEGECVLSASLFSCTFTPHFCLRSHNC